MKELFANCWWQLILIALGAYLVGGINFAMLFTKKIKHQDIRTVGSGNAGATNVFRVFGLRMGALTFFCDTLKGILVCLAVWLIFARSYFVLELQYWAGIFVTLGHVFPVFYNFRGGKGVATAIGVMLVVQPILLLCCVLPMCVVLFVVDRTSVMSILFTVFMIVWHWVVLREQIGIACCVFVSVTFFLLLFAHRHNIVRILTGKEARTGVRRKVLRQDKREARLAAQKQQEKLDSDDN